MGSFIVTVLFFGCMYYFFKIMIQRPKGQVDPNGLSAQYQALLKARNRVPVYPTDENSPRTPRSRPAASLTLTRPKGNLRFLTLPEHKGEAWALRGCLLACVVWAYVVAGTFAACLMVGAVLVCVSPSMYYSVKDNLEARRLLKSTPFKEETLLYIPEEWHH